MKYVAFRKNIYNSQYKRKNNNYYTKKVYVTLLVMKVLLYAQKQKMKFFLVWKIISILCYIFIQCFSEIKEVSENMYIDIRSAAYVMEEKI